MPALVLEPALAKTLRRNSRRAAFYCGAVASLGRDIAARGSALVCRRGPLARTVLALARESGAGLVVWAAAYDAAGLERQRALQSTLEEAGFRVSIVHDSPAVAPDETAAVRSADEGRGYRALAPYVAVWFALQKTPFVVRATFAAHGLPSEELPAPAEYSAPLCAWPAQSEAGAAELLEAFLHGPALHYAVARDVPAAETTSRLSAALSFGTIAARTVVRRVEQRGADPFLLTEERESLRAFTRALAQRDFFLQLGWFFEGAPDAAFQLRMQKFPFARTHPALEAWRTGRTGFPLVDAGTAQLRATGWMHPRVRLVVASFLCFDLGVDWRVGREAWDTELIEDDPALATGNWQWVAGVGADLAQFPRIYNPQKQLRQFDPLGRYVRRWMPELATLSDADLFDPQSAARRRQLSLPLYARSSYPAPVLEHEPAARAFLRRYAGFLGKPARP